MSFFKSVGNAKTNLFESHTLSSDGYNSKKNINLNKISNIKKNNINIGNKIVEKKEIVNKNGKTQRVNSNIVKINFFKGEINAHKQLINGKIKNKSFNDVDEITKRNIQLLRFSEEIKKISDSNIKYINDNKKLELKNEDYKSKLQYYIDRIGKKISHTPKYYEGKGKNTNSRVKRNEEVRAKSMIYANFYLNKIYENSKEIIKNKMMINRNFSKIKSLNDTYNYLLSDFSVIDSNIDDFITEINLFIKGNKEKLGELENLKKKKNSNTASTASTNSNATNVSTAITASKIKKN